MVRLPLDNTLTHYEFTTVLDLISYVFTFRWNDRALAWTFDLKLEDDTEIVTGARVVIGIPLLARNQHPNKPQGYLFAVDTSGKEQDPAIDDLGTRVKIVYFSAAEASAIQAELLE